MTREEIEKKMEELVGKYVETHDPEVREGIYELCRELEKLDKQSDCLTRLAKGLVGLNQPLLCFTLTGSMF
jgi:hypothetical protein